MSYIVLDLEFNQPFDFKSGKQTLLNSDCPFEIIQIGAVKLDENLNFVDNFETLVSPQIYTRIHPFVKKITGFQIEDFENAPLFPQAYKEFVEFISDTNDILCTWGGDDIKALFRNILFYKLDYSAIPNKYINIQSYASKYLSYGEGKAIGLKNAVELLKLPIENDFHNALNDSIYTAKIFQIVKPEEITAIAFNPLDIIVKKDQKVRISIKALKKHIKDAMGRELSADEQKIMKLSYKLGRTQTFDISHAQSLENKKRKSNKKEG